MIKIKPDPFITSKNPFVSFIAIGFAIVGTWAAFQENPHAESRSIQLAKDHGLKDIRYLGEVSSLVKCTKGTPIRTELIARDKDNDLVDVIVCADRVFSLDEVKIKKRKI